ncbi:caspase family protein [Aureispira sp. CCB-E]|uniref:caspase family protein n=1 Tax=Aureispira sp. CCB-E TaxID=3051121 RepID=UPI002868AE33|nr:caspase family protein [Aureispira sp. CCB-E]WMX12920.1 caspase family protein [Aureispira sp. CCB-E]
MKHSIIFLVLFVISFLLNPSPTHAQKVELRFQKGHHEPIVTIAISSDGKTLATGGTDMSIRFRDLDSGIESNTFRAKQWNLLGENARISKLEFSKDNQYLLCFVRSEVVDQLLLLRVSDHKILLESFQDGDDRHLAGGFFSPDGKSVVFCEGVNGQQLIYYNLQSLQAQSTPYYNLNKSFSKAHRQEHWTSFKYGVYHTPNQQTTLSMGLDWGEGLDENTEAGEVVFLLDARTGLPQKRIPLPAIKGGRVYAAIPDKNNTFFYTIPENGLDWNKVYWRKYSLETGELVDSMGTLLKEQENVVMNHCMTPHGQFVYSYYDSIYVCTPGEILIQQTWSAKDVRGNTSPERIQHLGDITAITSSADGNSVFVAFAGNNSARGGSHFTQFQGDFEPDIITIRQIDLSTGFVLREYASLGKTINALSFDPKGKSLWMVENESSYIPNKHSLLNVWKFREVGNLPTTTLASDEVKQLIFSPNRQSCFINYYWFHGAGIVQTNDYSYQDIVTLRQKSKAQPLFSLGLSEKTFDYVDKSVVINQNHTAAIDEDFNLYQISQQNINNNHYIGQLKMPNPKEEHKPNVHFMNAGKEVALLEVGKIKNYEKVTANNALHFYDVNTGKKTGKLDLGAMFWDFGERNATATNAQATLFAIAAKEEYKSRTETVASIYIVDAVKHTIKTKIPLVVDNCFHWQMDSETSQKICAPVHVSALAFSPNSKYLVGGWGNHQVRIWEVSSGKLLHRLEGHSSLITAISFHPNKAIMATAGQDAQIIFWDTKSWSILAKMILVDQNDYILYTEDGYYMATQKALDWVAFKKEQQLFNFEQFDLKFNRPDILMDSLGLASSILNRMLQKAYNKRLEKMGYTPDMLDDQFHVPSLSIMDPLPFEVKKSYLEFDVALEDTQETLNRLNVYVNDVPVYGLLGKDLSNGNPNQQTAKIQLQLSQGLNEITLSVTNKKGAESLKRKKVVAYNQPTKQAVELYVFAVGVSNYADSSRNLTFASKDAQDIATTFSNQTTFYQQIHTHYISNEKATLKYVLQQLELLQNTTVDDEIILYFSCHGLLDDQLNYYLAMHDTNFEQPQYGGLAYQTLESILAQIPARKRLLFIDACHSGEIDKSEVEQLAQTTLPHEAVQAYPKSGDYTLHPKMGLNNSFAYMQTLFSNVTKGTGTTIISAAGGMEFALESKEWNNSAFAYSVLEGLQSQKADLDQDGLVKISELQQYVTFNVHQLTDGQQVPTTRHINRSNDFFIFRY